MTVAIAKEVETGEQSVPQQKKPKKIGIPKEIYPNECRVAATPDTAKKLQKLGFEVLIESGAGDNANFPDEVYRQAECQIVPDSETLWTEADIVLESPSTGFSPHPW